MSGAGIVRSQGEEKYDKLYRPTSSSAFFHNPPFISYKHKHNQTQIQFVVPVRTAFLASALDSISLRETGIRYVLKLGVFPEDEGNRSRMVCSHSLVS